MTDIHATATAATLDALAGSAAIFDDLLRSIPADALDVKRGPGFWSLHEHAAHLAEVQPMILGRMQRILTEDVPEFVPFIPSEEEAAEKPPLPSVEEIVAAFLSGREQQLALLREAGPEGWERRAIHPEYSRYGLGVLARHTLMHDHWHMYRMEELWLTRDEYLSRLEG